MDVDRLRRELELFDPEVPIEDAWMPPSSWYTDPDILELERRSVLTRTWQPVARIDQLRERGAYVSGCLAGEPWIVVRGDDDELRAFHNVCRHKGREVLTGAGCVDRLVCGYHAWVYDLRGRLRRAPRMAGIRGFDRHAMSLVPLQVETWGPWVFINNSPSPTPSLRSRVAELDQTLTRGGWDRLRFVARRSWTLRCNWKVYVDNYLDGGYHIPHMHPTLDAQLDMGSYRTIRYGEYSVQTSAPASRVDARIDYDVGERIGDGALYAWIFPNFMLNRYGSCLDSNHVIPLGPDRCEVIYEFYFRDTESVDARRFIERSIQQSDVTQREDIEICESVQIGLRSESFDRGRYAPRVEIGEHHFHQLLAHHLRRALDDWHVTGTPATRRPTDSAAERVRQSG